MHLASRSISLLLAVCVCLFLSSCGLPELFSTAQSRKTPAFPDFQGSDGAVNKDRQFTAEYDGSTITVTWNGDPELIYRITRTDELTGLAESIALVYPGDAFLAEDIPLSEDFHYTYTLRAFADSASLQLSEPASPGETFVLRSGYLLEAGYLRFYTDNSPVGDTTANGLTFNPNGYYTCGDAELDDMIASLIITLTTPEMSRLEKFDVLYHYLTDSGNFSYGAARFITDDITDWQTDSAKAFLSSGIGNCFSYSAAVMLFARALGFEADTVIGECTQLYELVDHCWTEVTVDGKVYLCDAEMEGIYAPHHHVEWDLFLKEYGTTPTGYYFTEVSP